MLRDDLLSIQDCRVYFVFDIVDIDDSDKNKITLKGLRFRLAVVHNSQSD